MKKKLFKAAVGLIVVSASVGFYLKSRYGVTREMVIPLQEFSTAQYPEDPAERSAHARQYSDRTLRLVQNDATHFDFVLEPARANTAKIIFRNIDVSLFTPTQPEWTRQNPDLEIIALTDRQWNRQQVAFKPGSAQLEISGGDGFERTNLFTAELAKNCLNAGLWEVLLFTQENGQKALYYQGWFTFPLGHYKNIFEAQNGFSYWRHWRRLEHWVNPAGTPVKLEALRGVTAEHAINATFLADEPVFAAGEQKRKQRTTDAAGVLTWKDFYPESSRVQFASFVMPGRYDVRTPHKNEYQRLAGFKGATLREIKSPAGDERLHEIELAFRDGKSGETSRFIISGVALDKLPQLTVADYPKGLYMPMGIGVPPFYQGHVELTAHPPQRSPYFSVWLDAQGRWINHHEAGVDGPVLHRDKDDPNLLHLYLLSYERHSLVGHFLIPTR